jgi:rod shape-determining protein MreC
MAILNNRLRARKFEKFRSILTKFFMRHIALVIITLLVFTIQIARNTEQSKALVLELAGNFYQTVNKIFVSSSSVLAPVSDYVQKIETLNAENRQLQEQLSLLQQQLAKSELAENNNKELSSLLNFVSPLNTKYISTQILAMVDTAQGYYALIDGGKNYDIAINDLVVGRQGLIGAISEVCDNYSKVLLVNNSRFRMQVLTASGQRGLFIGNGNNPYVSYLSDPSKVEQGELIVTAGEKENAIPGIIIGRVTDVMDNKINAICSSDFNVRFVSIIKVVK